MKIEYTGLKKLRSFPDWRKAPLASVLQVAELPNTVPTGYGFTVMRCDHTVANGVSKSVLSLDGNTRGIMFSADPTLQSPAADVSDQVQIKIEDLAPAIYAWASPSVGDVVQFLAPPHGAIFVAFGLPDAQRLIGYACISSDLPQYAEGDTYDLAPSTITKLGKIGVRSVSN
jgi:hypothetical protein